MFKIGEFSRITQVSIRMLRYYDEVGLFKPAEIDNWTDHRRYSTDQIPTLNRILYLRDSGFNLSEIAEVIHTKDEILCKMLEKKYQEIEKNIRVEKEKLQKIELAKRQLMNDKNEIHYQVSIKAIPSQKVLSLRRKIPNYYSEGALWEELSTFAKSHQIQISSQSFSIYHDEDYREEGVDVELCAPVTQLGQSRGDYLFKELESVPIMACTMVYGSFSNIAGGFLAFAEWLQKNSQYQMIGKTRQIVHRGPWNENDPEKYLTEIQIPLLNF